jgi:hypothetical protein
MREKQLRLAIGASSNNMDCVQSDPRIKQLSTVGLYQIEMQAWADWGVARSALGEEKHRILCPHGIGVEDVVKKLPGIGKLRFKTGEHLISNGVAADANARPDRSHQVLRDGPKFHAHPPHSALNNAFYRPSPARMESPYGTALAIRDQHRHAIRRLNSQQYSRIRGNEPVTLSGRLTA